MPLKPLNDDEWIGQYRNSEYLASEDIDPAIEPIVTIHEVMFGEVQLQRGKEKKYVLVFAEETVPGIKYVKPLICNSTNKKNLKKALGGVKPSDLKGKKIQLYVDHKVRNPQDGGLTDGIRIRDFAPKVTGKAIKCEAEGCGKDITPAYGMTADKLAEYTKSKFGMCLCAACAEKKSNSGKETEGK